MDDLIYNQTRIPKEEYRYGLRSSAATGCGWIAAFNALRLMGYQVDKQALIRYFERQLPLIHGNAGTSFCGPAEYFCRWGFPVKMVVNRKKYDETLRGADVGILFYRWHQGIRLGAHFVAVKHENGSFMGYNTYRYSTGADGYGPSLEAYIKRQGWFGTVLIAIERKKTAP